MLKEKKKQFFSTSGNNFLALKSFTFLGRVLPIFILLILVLGPYDATQPLFANGNNGNAEEKISREDKRDEFLIRGKVVAQHEDKDKNETKIKSEKSLSFYLKDKLNTFMLSLFGKEKNDLIPLGGSFVTICTISEKGILPLSEINDFQGNKLFDVPLVKANSKGDFELAIPKEKLRKMKKYWGNIKGEISLFVCSSSKNGKINLAYLLGRDIPSEKIVVNYSSTILFYILCGDSLDKKLISKACSHSSSLLVKDTLERIDSYYTLFKVYPDKLKQKEKPSLLSDIYKIVNFSSKEIKRIYRDTGMTIDMNDFFNFRFFSMLPVLNEKGVCLLKKGSYLGKDGTMMMEDLALSFDAWFHSKDTFFNKLDISKDQYSRMFLFMVDGCEEVVLSDTIPVKTFELRNCRWDVLLPEKIEINQEAKLIKNYRSNLKGRMYLGCNESIIKIDSGDFQSIGKKVKNKKKLFSKGKVSEGTFHFLHI